MIESVFQYDPSCNKSWEEYEDELWETYTIELTQCGEEADRLIGLANRVLELQHQDWLSDLLKLVTSPVYQAVKVAKKDTMIVFERTCKFAAQGEVECRLLSELHSVEEVWELYYRTHFYLRRIEQHLPEEICREMLLFIQERHLPPEYFLLVLEEDAYEDWRAAGRELTEFLRRNGQAEYAQVIENGIEQRVKKSKE